MKYKSYHSEILNNKKNQHTEASYSINEQRIIINSSQLVQMSEFAEKYLRKILWFIGTERPNKWRLLMPMAVCLSLRGVKTDGAYFERGINVHNQLSSHSNRWPHVHRTIHTQTIWNMCDYLEFNIHASIFNLHSSELHTSESSVWFSDWWGELSHSWCHKDCVAMNLTATKTTTAISEISLDQPRETIS